MSHKHLEGLSRKELGKIERDDAYLHRSPEEKGTLAIRKSLSRRKRKMASDMNVNTRYRGNLTDYFEKLRGQAGVNKPK